MSYARFSSDDFKSDIYCYACDPDGYQLSVAEKRISNQEDIPKIDLSSDNALIKSHREQAQWFRDHKTIYEDIDLEYAGQHFSIDTAQELYEMLVKLSHIGYHVPSSAFEQILEDM